VYTGKYRWYALLRSVYCWRKLPPRRVNWNCTFRRPVALFIRIVTYRSLCPEAARACMCAHITFTIVRVYKLWSATDGGRAEEEVLNKIWRKKKNQESSRENHLSPAMDLNTIFLFLFIYFLIPYLPSSAIGNDFKTLLIIISPLRHRFSLFNVSVSGSLLINLYLYAWRVFSRVRVYVYLYLPNNFTKHRWADD
jgi:hypothetical protein